MDLTAIRPFSLKGNQTDIVLEVSNQSPKSIKEAVRNTRGYMGISSFLVDCLAQPCVTRSCNIRTGTSIGGMSGTQSHMNYLDSAN
jgi:hypothetical protein